MRVFELCLSLLLMISVSTAIHDVRRATTPKIRSVLDRLISGMEMAQSAEDQAFENVKRECNVTETTSDETLARLKSALPEREKFATRKVILYLSRDSIRRNNNNTSHCVYRHTNLWEPIIFFELQS